MTKSSFWVTERMVPSVMEKNYFVYMMSNESKMLYIGVTNDVERRAFQHKSKLL